MMAFLRQSIAGLLGLAIALGVSLYIARDQAQQLLALQARDSAAIIASQLGDVLRDHQNPTLFAQTFLQGVTQSGAYAAVTFTRAQHRHGSIDQIQAPFTVTTPHYVRDVPAWFQEWIALRPPEVEAEVRSGWDFAGHVVVSRHPAPALQLLWRLTLGMAGAGLVLLTLAMWYSRKTRLRHRRELAALRAEQQESWTLLQAVNRQIIEEHFAERASAQREAMAQAYKKHTQV